ncbi:hypothetical protein SDRG_08362 [Saprolegnia diclina VS20]|uniref:TNFR-Cys domain-containing protein n=1 Tax=Saprolegnia diclina (strain VS20) TaxID=1156394 RepID=T0Q8E7_SAPDV|nr:hypothetical protein SDRG_08362 [Saprolegnia diclina VS20]EQC34154.1 hypothetical protein SDRG_08362 [Saprolegnia diclina VS20]|eukprot:XP_008612466.1 hypothetical protein SDRG_08362 [Saprolegnia diclina VS20]
MKASSLLFVALAAVSTNHYGVDAQAICKQRTCTTDTGLFCDRALQTCPECMGADSSTGTTVCKPTNFIGTCNVVGIGGFQKCGKYTPPSSGSGSGSGSGGITPKPTTVKPTLAPTLAPTTLAPTTTEPVVTTLAPTTTPTATTKKPTSTTPKTTPATTTSSSSGSGATPTPTATPSNANNAHPNSTTDSGINWALYGGIAGGAVVLIAVVLVVVLKMNNRDDDDDDEPYKPTAPATSQNYTSTAAATTYEGGSAAVVAANLRAQIDGQNQPQATYNPYGNNNNNQSQTYNNYGQQPHDNYSNPQSSYAQPNQYNNTNNHGYAPAQQDYTAVSVAPAAKPRSDVTHSDVWGNVPSSYQDGTPTAKNKLAHPAPTHASDVRDNETRLSVEF